MGVNFSLLKVVSKPARTLLREIVGQILYRGVIPVSFIEISQDATIRFFGQRPQHVRVNLNFVGTVGDIPLYFMTDEIRG